MREKTWLGLALCGTALLCTLAACSSDGGGSSSLEALGIDDGASEGLSKSLSVKGDKDVEIALDTGALVEVPAGAVTKEVRLTLERPADGKALELVEKFKNMQDRIVSAPYVLTPHGTKFEEDVTVTLPVSKEGMRDLSVAWLEDEHDKEWKLLGAATTDGKKASVVVKHFSVMVLVADASDLPPVEENDAPTDDAGGENGTDDAGAAEAGTASPDASTEDDIDAGNGGTAGDAALDAGTAGSGGDASTSLPADAGGDTAASEASAPVAAQYAELVSCGLELVDGGFSPGGLSGLRPFEGSYQLCIHACYSSVGNCNDRQIYRCNLSTGVFSDPLVACINSCPSPASRCPGDEITVVSFCDGVTECPNGEDENDCDPQLLFPCQGAERVAQSARCDGFADCSNGLDEQDCFVCDDATELLPPYMVCNGWYECQDLSDEPATCAQFMCGQSG